MPLDVQLFRKDQGGDPDLIRESQKKRFKDVKLVDNVIEFDNKARKSVGQLDDLNKQSNKLDKQFAEIMKKTKKEKRDATEEEKKEMEKIKEDKKSNQLEQTKLKKLTDEYLQKRDSLIYKIGNIVYPKNVPISNNEDNNKVMKVWKPKGFKILNNKDNKNLKHHHELLYMIGGYEPEKGANVCGHRGYFLTGNGVLLNMALQSYGIQYLLKHKYNPVYPPYFMNKDMMSKTAQLEDFDEALYHVKGETQDTEKYLIATSEQPISALHYNEHLSKEELPLKYAGVSTCFRKEAGAHGKDAWGIFRVHQFEKIEQFVFCEPSESEKYHDEMINTAAGFYESLNIPYEIVSIASGALNNAAAIKYDLEGWFPTLSCYRELVSASNCTDYQSRAMNTRFGFQPKKNTKTKEKKEYVHMLNATLVATTRTLCCILENYQTDDGIHVPKVLQSYMGGVTFIPFIRPPPVNKQKNKEEQKQPKQNKKQNNQKQNNQKENGQK